MRKDIAMSVFSVQHLQGRNGRFAPNADPEGKSNYGRHLFIDKDGSVSEVIRLNVLDDRHREDIIGFHFSRQYAELHYRESEEPPQFYVVGRDCPWDFEYVMHDSTTFFLEICRIADKKFIKAIKAENDLATILRKEEVTGYDILKIEKNFPGVFRREAIERIKTRTDKQSRYKIDLNDKEPELFVRPPFEPMQDVTEEIRSAISKKVAKKHKGKDRTILLLDNLTTHADPENFFDAVDSLRDFLEDVPFPSIWLYTGYYSDDDGFNCEYSLVPLKLSEREMELMERAIS